MFSKQTWPNSRTMKSVEILHTPNSMESLKPGSTPYQLSIVDTIKSGDSLLDLGMGTGQFLIDLALELHKQGKKAELIGVTATPDEVKSRACRYANIRIIKAKFPCHSARMHYFQDNPEAGRITMSDDERVLNFLYEKQGKIDHIFDTFGPSTYCFNTFEQLIYAAILLKEGGRFSAITSTEGTDPDCTVSVFGTYENRAKMIDFFKDHLDIELCFTPTAIQSSVHPGKINTDLLVSFTKGERLLLAEDYPTLCRMGDTLVGLPEKSEAWYNYKGYNIAMRLFKTPASHALEQEQVIVPEGEKESYPDTLNPTGSVL